MTAVQSALFTRPGHGHASAVGHEIDVDNFAGGGGVAMGFEMATGKAFDIAINHDPAALEMHAANHPLTEHVCENVWEVDPVALCAGRSVRLAWFSPDCTHFSRAKGAKPVKQSIRGLAWVAVRWAKRIKPRVIMLENVREFMEWGPLTSESLPCPRRKGMTFKRFVGTLRGLGYVVEWKVLNAADFGAPTHRRRLFLIARSDGLPIVWPEKSHGPKLKPYRTAAECIDWSIPCPSIFDRKKPLADKTLRRIALGIKRYVLENPRPFVVPLNHGGHCNRARPADEPHPTITRSRGEYVCVPNLINIERSYKDFSGQAADVPLGTITAMPKGGKHAMVAAMLKHYGGVVGHSVERAVGTITAKDHHSLLTATVVGVGGRAGDSPPCSVEEPGRTTTAKADRALVAATLTQFRGTNHGNGGDPAKPAPAVCSQGLHTGLVYAFLAKYFGTAIGQAVDTPAHTVTSKDRFGVVTVSIDGEPYIIADIGLRMLTPRELARCQGFPDDYVLTGSKSNQVAKIGNSVPPQVVSALVNANLSVQPQQRKATR